MTTFARMKLLTTANNKIKKGEKLGYMSFGIHLAPSTLSGFNTCNKASLGCSAACLNLSGHGIYKTVQASRIAKTKMFFNERSAFMTQLVKEITAAIKKAKKNGMKPAFRLNLTSDLPWEKIKHNGRSVFEMFPDVTYYDYCADSARMSAFLDGKMPANYHLTFSRKENTPDVLIDSILASGGNVAAVFRGAIPATWRGFPTLNGDESDTRFLDGKGKVVALIQKGLAKKDKRGFVLEPQEVAA